MRQLVFSENDCFGAMPSFCKISQAQLAVSYGCHPPRVFPIDMAGFAINLCLVMAHPSVVIGNDKKGKLSSPGYLESNFLEQLVEKESLECYAPSKEVPIQWGPL